MHERNLCDLLGIGTVIPPAAEPHLSHTYGWMCMSVVARPDGHMWLAVGRQQCPVAEVLVPPPPVRFSRLFCGFNLSVVL